MAQPVPTISVRIRPVGEQQHQRWHHDWGHGFHLYEGYVHVTLSLAIPGVALPEGAFAISFRTRLVLDMRDFDPFAAAAPPPPFPPHDGAEEIDADLPDDYRFPDNESEDESSSEEDPETPPWYRQDGGIDPEMTEEEDSEEPMVYYSVPNLSRKRRVRAWVVSDSDEETD